MRPKTLPKKLSLTWSWNRTAVIKDASVKISAEKSYWRKQIIPMCPCNKLRHERSFRHQPSSKRALITQQHNSENRYGWTCLLTHWRTKHAQDDCAGKARQGWDRGGRKAWVSGSGGCEGESWCCHSPPFNALPFPLITKHSHFGIYLFWVTTALVTLCITANTPKVTLVRIDVTNKTTQTWLINKQYKTVGLNEDQFCDNEKCANK